MPCSSNSYLYSSGDRKQSRSFLRSNNVYFSSAFKFLFAFYFLFLFVLPVIQNSSHIRSHSIFINNFQSLNFLIILLDNLIFVSLSASSPFCHYPISSSVSSSRPLFFYSYLSYVLCFSNVIIHYFSS